MQPSTMILFEGTLSLVLPVAWAVHELLALKRTVPPGPPPRRADPVILPLPLSPDAALPQAAPPVRRPARALQDA